MPQTWYKCQQRLWLYVENEKGKVEAVEYYYNKKMEDYFEWELVLYSSLSACCTKFDVSLKAVRNRAWRKNCSIQEAFRHCLRRKQSLETDVFLL